MNINHGFVCYEVDLYELHEIVAWFPTENLANAFCTTSNALQNITEITYCSVGAFEAHFSVTNTTCPNHGRMKGALLWLALLILFVGVGLLSGCATIPQIDLHSRCERIEAPEMRIACYESMTNLEVVKRQHAMERGRLMLRAFEGTPHHHRHYYSNWPYWYYHY